MPAASQQTIQQLIKTLNDSKPRRTFEVRSIDEEKRTVELAFSSEEPYRRWFGNEVLGHDTDEIRLDRLQDGAPLLFNHHFDKHIGTIESVTVSNDKVGRVLVRFGNSELANEKWRDVVDDILKKSSVGYLVHAMRLVEERDDGVDEYRVTDWEPYEVSLVTVPADNSVGVGRSMDDNSRSEITPEETDEQNGNTASHGETEPEPNNQSRDIEMPDPVKPEQTPPADDQVNARQERQAGTDAERKRVKTIMDMVTAYGHEQLGMKHIADGKSPEDFQKALLEEMNKRGQAPVKNPPSSGEDAELGMNDKEVRQYSFMKAIRALANPQDIRVQKDAAFEIECSHAAAEKSGKSAQGIIVPQDVLSRAISPGGTGAEVIATDLLSESFIDVLLNRSVVLGLCTQLSGLVGNVDIPRMASGATGYWVDDDEDVTASQQEFDKISLSPKTVGALVEITRRQLVQSSLDMEGLVRRDIARQLALTIDLAALYGTGGNNQPTGVANTSGINSVTFAKANQPTFTELVQMESEISADNADVNSMKYLLDAKLRGHCKTTEKFSGSNGQTIWETGNTINGYSTEVTNQMKAGEVIFGNWADLICGMWGGLDLTVDPFTHSAKGRVRVVAFEDVDFAMRHVESFCRGKVA
ncbi:phage major capsid protein [Endozoicomonas euniceicola]|uniref:Phage major capsid protein n=1 Tax=Endozoicomonas euniceicola TaxID=1234143 RepID=A0ABY6GNM6_9GAMM|nr:phage major capsid protein [Endozoicomonas euniceicola]UYM14265.1 phage major capsid protein [Endozoicomonas euniceicola]